MPNGFEVLQSHKRLCESKGYITFTPLDGELPSGIERDRSMAEKIFEVNCELIRKSDIIIANCNFFRGACTDDGTAFEIGYGFSLGKKIWGYRNSLVPLHQITAELISTTKHDSGYRMDENGYLLNEDFGNAINLMLEFSILQSGGKLVLGGLEEVLNELNKF